jgi:hypothetical protein
MKTIPVEFVDAIWEQVQSADTAEAMALAQQMQNEQPYVVAYLLASEDEGDGGKEGDERDGASDPQPGRLIELGAIAWRIMSTANRALPQVSPEHLMAAEEANFESLMTLDEGPESLFEEGTARLFRGYNQMPLLGALLEALMAGNEETPELADDSVGLDLLRLKSVIDCLDRQDPGVG